jgi:hypothetical protein
VCKILPKLGKLLPFEASFNFLPETPILPVPLVFTRISEIP